jgi:hypothetical protein
MRHAQPVTGAAFRRQRHMRGATLDVMKMLLSQLVVLREAATGKYDADACLDLYGLPLAFPHDRADDTVIGLVQADSFGRAPDFDFAIQHRLEKTGGKRVAVHKPGAAAMKQHVATMLEHPRGHERRRFGRSRGVEEMLEIRPAVQPHAHEGRFRHRLPSNAR